ncbi:carboxylesterase family protein [Umezawaea beigongshangensis]|uniref:carboxylesterase family protein n=1 Tax=Umezawaea beigongshangensis TaxID=2780383 RepID=UPI0027DC84F6|nr:carboxylesterase family protein [Umezawaea beigongshangensis]
MRRGDGDRAEPRRRSPARSRAGGHRGGRDLVRERAREPAPGLQTGKPDDDSGNFGTLDQIEALRFVDRNARAFGGDPANVTVTGRSAGAVDVRAPVVSPLTEGLVAEVIPLGGGLLFATRTAVRTYAEGVFAFSFGRAPRTVRGGRHPTCPPS